MTKKINIHKNTILYGPPGTGKTYNTIAYAVAIIDGKEIFQDKKTGAITVKDYADRESLQKRFNELKETNLVEFCTFHQSYSYEEFIEGIKPKVEIDGITNEKRIIYEVTDGVFKKFCENKVETIPTVILKQAEDTIEEVTCVTQENIEDKSISNPLDNTALLKKYGIRANPNIYKINLGGTYDNEIRTECLKSHIGHIRIGWGDDLTLKEIINSNSIPKELNSFVKMQIGDIVFSQYSETKYDAIGVVIGDLEKLSCPHYQQSRKVYWLLKDIEKDILSINKNKRFAISASTKLPHITLEDILFILEEHNAKEYIPYTETALGESHTPNNKVFIIDEINRGNISKIFGELITLIEDSKRIDATKNNLSQGMRIRLPYSHNNNDIGFGVPDNIYILGTMNTADRSIALIDTALRRRFKFIEMAPSFNLLNSVIINGINICNMMERINERIEILYDRDHKIGHSFFMKLNNNSTIGDLAEIFEYDIIPLLQEYFYNDWEKIAVILGDDFERKDKTYNFINRIEIKDDIVRKYDMDKIYTYNLNKDAFEKAITYVKIYEPSTLNNTTLESAHDGE